MLEKIREKREEENELKLKITFGKRKQIELMEEDIKGFHCKFNIEGKNMKNYIVINGKKAELTEEQLKQLGIKSEKNEYEKMFERSLDTIYYYIGAADGVIIDKEDLHRADSCLYNVGNYCKDKALMKQRALHETLNRLLWRASIIAGESCNPWDSSVYHYYIYFDTESGHFGVDYSISWSNQGICYFPTKKSAEDAIENIVKPFVKEHPDFVW